MPSHGAQGVEAVAVQATDVLGGISAAVGDHEQAGGQRQLLVQELELFEDGASAVTLSVQAVTEDGQTALAIDHGGEADLDHEFLAGIAVADMGGGPSPASAWAEASARRSSECVELSYKKCAVNSYCLLMLAPGQARKAGKRSSQGSSRCDSVTTAFPEPSHGEFAMLLRATAFVLGVLVVLGVRTAGLAADSDADIIKELQSAGLKADKGFVQGIMVTVLDDHLTDDGRIKPEILKILKRAKHIEKLSFGATKNSVIAEKSRISDKGLADLKDLGECRAISLRAAGEIKDDGWKSLASLKSLRIMDLTNTAITDAGLAAFKDLQTLEELVLNTCKNLRGDGFANLKSLPKLEKLYLLEVKVEDSGLEQISGIASLESLYLGDSWLAFKPTSIDYPLTDKGVAYLKNLKNLEFLTFRACAKVSDAGVTAALKNKPKLHTLNIGYCPKITDAAMAEIKNLEKLSTLWVDYTAVTDKGLAELHGLKRLSSLAIEKSKVTNEGIAALKKALPKISVDKP
jgi:hypothetical protein